MNQILAWQAIWSFALTAVGFLQLGILRNRWVKLAFFPGLVVEAVLRLAIAALTKTPVKGFSPFGKDKAFLETADSKWGPPGTAISVFLRGLVLIVANLVLLLDFEAFTGSGFALPFIDQESLSKGSLQESSFQNFFEGLKLIPTQMMWSSWYGLFITYLILSVVLAFGFKRKVEFIASGLIWGGLFLLFFVSEWLGITFGFFSRGWLIQVFFAETIWTTFSFLVLCTFAVLLTLILWRCIHSLWPHHKTAPK